MQIIAPVFNVQTLLIAPLAINPQMLVLPVTQDIIYNHRQPAQHAALLQPNAPAAQIHPPALNVAVDNT